MIDQLENKILKKKKKKKKRAKTKNIWKMTLEKAKYYLDFGSTEEIYLDVTIDELYKYLFSNKIIF